MYNLEKFKGVIPAFYACYDEKGNVSEERTKVFVDYLYEKGVRGLYITGSSGECIYQSVEERKLTTRYVMEATKGRMTVIVHVGSAATKDSVELAKCAKEYGADAIASIPPIYFALSEDAVCSYWKEIMDAADLPFIIYNIPQTTGFSLSKGLFKKMLEDSRVIGVKNTSLPVMDIQQFKECGGENCIVFNGPDEQFAAGRLMGADSGIGGTYCVMPELYLKIDQYINDNDYVTAGLIQREVTNLIMELTGMKGHMYSVAKEILKLRGMDIGAARLPLPPVTKEDMPKIVELEKKISDTIRKYCQ